MMQRQCFKEQFWRGNAPLIQIVALQDMITNYYYKPILRRYFAKRLYIGQSLAATLFMQQQRGKWQLALGIG